MRTAGLQPLPGPVLSCPASPGAHWPALRFAKSSTLDPVELPTDWSPSVPARPPLSPEHVRDAPTGHGPTRPHWQLKNPAHTCINTHTHTHNLHVDTGTQRSHIHTFTHHTHTITSISNRPHVPHRLVQAWLQEKGLVSSQALHCGTLLLQRPQYSSRTLGSFLGLGAQNSGNIPSLVTVPSG